MTTPRLPALHPRPITFAHRGAKAEAPENTLEAFTRALELGATGLESDVWVTADGVCVLDHDGFAMSKLRRRPIARLNRAELPEHIPTLEQLYATCGTDMELSLDIKDPAAFAPVMAVARAAGGPAVERLWLCHPDLELVSEWRDAVPARDTHVRLVNSTQLKRMSEGPERRAANLAAAGIDAVNLHHLDWTGGLTTLFHRFELLTFAWDAQYPRVLSEMFDIGIDAVYSDHVGRMVDAFAAAYGPTDTRRDADSDSDPGPGTGGDPGEDLGPRQEP